MRESKFQRLHHLKINQGDFLISYERRAEKKTLKALLHKSVTLPAVLGSFICGLQKVM